MAEKKRDKSEKQRPPIRADIERCVVREAEAGLDVEITVRNEESRPVFVTVGVRQIQLDEARGTVDVWFADHARDVGRPASRCRIDSRPRTRSVEQAAAITFTARLRQTYTKMVVHEDQSFDFEVVDLRKAHTLVAHIAVAEAPFYFNPRRGSLIAQLVEWGEARTFTTEMPGKESSA